MTDSLGGVAARLSEYGQDARVIRGVVEQAIGLIDSAIADLQSLEGPEASEAIVLARQARNDLSNAAYGWLTNVDTTAVRFAADILTA